MAADRPIPPAPEVPLGAERRHRILTEGAARFRRRRLRRNGTVFGVAAVVIVVAAVALVGRVGQPTTQVATSPQEVVGPMQHPGPTTPSPGSSTVPPAALPEPKPSDVKDGRFVHAVALDGGALVVKPAPAGLQPTTSKDAAQHQFWSTAELAGSHESIVFGFGLVTVRNPTPPQTVNDVQATYERIPAWIGFALGGEYSCPAQPVGTTTTAGAVSGPGQAEAVVLPAGGPGSNPGERPFPSFSFVYTGTVQPCVPGVHRPGTEASTGVSSLPWTLVSQRPGQVVIRYSPGFCRNSYWPGFNGPVVTTADGHATIAVLVTTVDGMPVACGAGPNTTTVTVSIPAGATNVPLHAPTGEWIVVQGPGIPTT